MAADPEVLRLHIQNITLQMRLLSMADDIAACKTHVKECAAKVDEARQIERIQALASQERDELRALRNEVITKLAELQGAVNGNA